jgi:hypothetical protein
MSTVRRRAAYRRNARFSTGQVTEVGKKKVRGNALKHGIYAQAELTADWEDPLHLGHLDDYRPVGFVEQELTAQTVQAICEIRRLTHIEQYFYETQLAKLLKACPHTLSVGDDSCFSRIWHRNPAQTWPVNDTNQRLNQQIGFVSQKTPSTPTPRPAEDPRSASFTSEKPAEAPPTRQSAPEPSDSLLAIQLPAEDLAPAVGNRSVNSTKQKQNCEIGFVSQKTEPRPSSPKPSRRALPACHALTRVGARQPSTGRARNASASSSIQRSNPEIGFVPQNPGPPWRALSVRRARTPAGTRQQSTRTTQSVSTSYSIQ